MYALLTKWRCRRQRRNSPETYSCSVGTEGDFCAYSLLPSAVGRDDPEASHSPHQHKSIRICNNLWFPGISNTCISPNPKSTLEQLSMKSHQSQNLLLSWFWRHTCQSTDFGLSYLTKSQHHNISFAVPLTPKQPIIWFVGHLSPLRWRTSEGDFWRKKVITFIQQNSLQLECFEKEGINWSLTCLSPF